MNRWKLLLIFFACLAVRLHALTAFSDEELRFAPTASRLAEIERTAAVAGWRGLAEPLRVAAFRAYEKESLAAEDWFFVSRWAEIFATTDSDFMAGWIKAIKAAQVGHANMPTRYAVHNRPLADGITPALQAWLLSHTDFSAQFFSILSSCDFLPKTFSILGELQARYPDKFPTYANLALAIAVVYDVPPPPNWPHAQVDARVLKRQLPASADAFAFWIKADQSGQTLQRLTQLSAGELKFVVDAAAPFSELEWAQKNITLPLASFNRVYDLVRYRVDRVQQDQYLWPAEHYDLASILNEGGICVDQAYFSCEVGKAKGVPTLLFSGAGRDAWHAWFGYLDQSRHWQLDAGRYADQQFVTGLAIDPQTWGPISDHELKFLSEGFRLLPSWRQACLNAEFAAAYLSLHKPDAAARAARMAVNYEPRHLGAWQILLMAQSQLGLPPLEIEKTLREGRLAFQNYPDIEAVFVQRLAASLRARGETSAADFEENQFSHKVGGARADLNLNRAVNVLRTSLARDPPAAQLRTYYSLLSTFGRGAGMEFFSRIVRPFVEYQYQAGHRQEAFQAAQQAQRTLRIEPNSQLEQDMRQLLQEINH
ncbi:MAG: hypothetical protein KGJ37_02900 [Verrucomicrobiota bacterium]|nr:hypothetical protein [Verrucomicrobiota bacterium]